MRSKKTSKAGAVGSVKAARGKGRPFKKGNTHRWRTGVSGNPSGGSKAQTLSAAYRHKLKEPVPEHPSMTYADLVADTLVKAAAAGDVGAAREIADRVEGKARQSLSVAIDDRMNGVIESGVAALVATGLSEEEARQYLSEYLPEVSQWTN